MVRERSRTAMGRGVGENNKLGTRGGRTLDWIITLELRRSRELKMMVRAHRLSADQSYERYLGEDGDRILVPLQQVGTHR